MVSKDGLVDDVWIASLGAPLDMVELAGLELICFEGVGELVVVGGNVFLDHDMLAVFLVHDNLQVDHGDVGNGMTGEFNAVLTVENIT